MAKLIIDTCSWLDLAKPKFIEVFQELESQVDAGNTVLLVSNIIIEEWDRHRDKILESIKSTIKSYAKSAENMADLLGDAEKQVLTSIVNKYKNIESEQEKAAKDYLLRIEKLLKSAKVYTISDKIKIEMADRAVAKEAPFHNSKNNMADALLYFGALEYVRINSDIANDLFFVTENYKEFSDPNNSNKLHPQLAKPNVHFYNNVAHALKMRKELVDEMDEYHDYQLSSWIEMQAEIARGK